MLARRFAVWAVASAALAAVFVFLVLGHLRIQTDILAMLPAVERDPVAEQAAKAMADTTGARTLFLVGAPEFAAARAAAADFAAALQQAAVFERVVLHPEFQAAAADQLYAPYRALLLSDRHRQTLAAGQAATLVQDALQGLYTPAGWLRAQPFAEDPLNLYGDFLMQQLPAAGRLRVAEAVLAASGPDGEYVLVTAMLSGSPFAIAEQQRVMPAVDAAMTDLARRHPRAQVLSASVIRHATAQGGRARGEIALFSSVSLAGVVLLVLLTFRSLRPLLLTLGSLGVGTMAALTACHFLFEQVNLLTLVFGSTLIGVAVDYSIHFFADQFRHAGRWDARATLHHVGPAILLGMFATALGYQAFLLPPFPGLRQIAVFSVAGIAAACACVLLAYPLLANRQAASHRPALLRLAARLEALRPDWRGPRMRLALMLAAGLLAAGLWRLEFVDDVRVLQSPPPSLLEQDRKVRAVLGELGDTRFLLVRGAGAEGLLQAEEELRDALDALVVDRKLGGYRAVSQALPSQQRQQQNHALLAAQVYGADGALAQLLRQVGYEPPKIEQLRAAFPPALPLTLTPEAWLAADASAPLRPQWLGAVAGGHASTVTLTGIHDLAALQAIERRLPAVRLVDRVEAISRVMQHYRRIASACLAGALALIGVVFALRYGPRQGLQLLAAPLGAALLTLATLGLLGISANLTNVLALLLVLGMGVDYAVFMREGREFRATVVMAILLAGALTLLSFGMLAFSATPFIRSIGLTVLLGVSYTFVLALLSTPRSERLLRGGPGCAPPPAGR